MSVVDRSLFASGGLLAGDDVLSLALGLMVTGRYLVDDAVGARHELHPSAAFLMRRLQMPLSFSEWLRLCEKRHIKPEEALELLMFLNSLGGLKIQRSWGTWLRLFSVRLLFTMHGVRWESHIKRYPLSIHGVAMAVTQASWLICLLAAVSTLGLLAVGLPLESAIGYPWLSYGIFWFGTVIHESVHGIFTATGAAVVLQKNMNVGILHQPLGNWRNTLSAICGPLVGALVVGLVWAISTDIVELPFMVPIAGFLAGAQLWSLMPWYGDGKTLWNIYKEFSWKRSNAMSDME